MAVLSSNTLFHFTNKLEVLEDILINGFNPRISVETLLVAEKELHMAFPMKCFCDIPLSQTNMHMNIYGYYAIGLHKDWGIRNNISPLIYYCQNSPTFDSIIKIMELISDDKKISEENLNKVGSIFLYSKPYLGRFYRDGQFLKKEVKFYDEREWRYIPSVNKLEKEQFDWFLIDDDIDFFDQSRLNEINNNLAKKNYYKLKFEPNDIKYIIVKNDNEVLQIIDTITKCNNQFSYKDVQLLNTRIITSEQIKEDF